MSQIQKAAMSYPVIKGYAKNAERKVYGYLPVSRKHAAYIGSFATIAISGRINTNKIKNINISFFGGNMRPDIVYDLRSGATSGLVVCQWSF